MLVLECLLQRQRAAVSHREDKDTGSRSSGKYSLAWAFPESTISPTSPGRIQGWVASGQTTNREGTQPHPSADKQIKVLLSSAHQRNTQLYHHQPLPSGNLHKPLREPHPPEGREQKQEKLQSCSLWNKNHIHRKIDKMKRQKAMYQMKEQDKTPEKH